MNVMANGRCKKAEKALFMIMPLLGAQNIPLGLRVTVLKAVLLSTLLYGSEVWGMHEGRCSATQTIVNKALRVRIGCRQKDTSISVARVWYSTSVCLGVVCKTGQGSQEVP